jgi:hypothetical protein
MSHNYLDKASRALSNVNSVTVDILVLVARKARSTVFTRGGTKKLFAQKPTSSQSKHSR